jgi:arginyl-tRNA synthetase
VACDRILDGIRGDLDHFRVRFDRGYREESLHREGGVGEVIAELRNRGLLHDSEGAVFFKTRTKRH